MDSELPSTPEEVLPAGSGDLFPEMEEVPFDSEIFSSYSETFSGYTTNDEDLSDEARRIFSKLGDEHNVTSPSSIHLYEALTQAFNKGGDIAANINAVLPEVKQVADAAPKETSIITRYKAHSCWLRPLPLLA